jgi:hypothetical protein
MTNALTTGDKLLRWGYQGETNCIFCRNGVETRDHLFFSCSFRSGLWWNLTKLCDLEDTSTCWAAIVDVGVQNWRKKVMKYVVCRLVFGAATHFIWRNRNDLRHDNTPFSEE